MEVNVEKIMADIRAEIKEKGYTSDMLSFKDVTAKGSFEGGDSTELGEAVRAMNAVSLVPYDPPITGNPIAVFIKKIIRKLIRFYIRPTVEQQNEFNAQTVNAVSAIGRYASAVNGGADTAVLSQRVELLEASLEAVSKENEELRRRIERLEQAISDGN